MKKITNLHLPRLAFSLSTTAWSAPPLDADTRTPPDPGAAIASQQYSNRPGGPKAADALSERNGLRATSPGTLTVLPTLQSTVAPSDGKVGSTGGHAERTSGGVTNSQDNNISSSLLRQIGNSPGMAPVSVTTQNGVVTVSGMVPTFEERDRLLSMARSQPGVLSVVDRLQVRAVTPESPLSESVAPGTAR